jgi:hypothetical protein
LTFIANCEIEAVQAIQFAWLTGEPWKSNVESANRTVIVTIGLIVISFTFL